MNTVKYPLFTALFFVLTANFSTQDQNVNGREKPTINFSGTLRDTTAKEYKVQNITISGQYHHIPVYQKPTSPDIDPSTNTTYLDFSSIQMIRIPNPTIKLTFNNRHYTEIEVTLIGQSKMENYIIETSKRVLCDEVTAAGPIEKDLSFEAVDTITFGPHHHNAAETDSVKNCSIKTSNAANTVPSSKTKKSSIKA